MADFRGSGDWETDADWQATEQLKELVRCEVGRSPRKGLSSALFDRIVDWKLRAQRGRTENRRARLTPDIVEAVTGAAFRLEDADPLYLARVRTGLVASLPGVGLGLASAVLTVTFPESYGVIDFRVWRVFFNEDRRSFRIPHYLRYLRELRVCADRLRWDAQHVDFFAWKLYGTPEKTG